MLTYLCSTYRTISNTLFSPPPVPPDPAKKPLPQLLWTIKYLHGDQTITDRTIIHGDIHKANFASLIYFEEKYRGSEKPFYLTVADIDIYITPLAVDVKPSPSGVPSAVPSAALSGGPSITPSNIHPPSEKQLTTTALPFEDLNVIIAAWAELCEPKTEERYSSEECYWDNIAGLVMAVRKAMVRTPRRNRLEEGDWVVGYMHRSVKQQKEKGKEKENRKEVGEVVGDQKLDSDAVKEEPALRTLQALQASPDSRGSQALQPIQVPKQERYKRITVSGTKRRVCKDAEMYFRDVCPFHGGTSEAVGEMEIWSSRDLGNMKEGDLVAVWVIPEKLLK